MAAYIFFDVREIIDPERLSTYRAQVFATVEQFRGRYRILGGVEAPLEGDWLPNIPVLIEFPDMEAARAWYASDIYAALKAERHAAAICDAVLLSGFSHEPARTLAEHVG